MTSLPGLRRPFRIRTAAVVLAGWSLGFAPGVLHADGPNVVETDPANGARDVSTGANIVIKFDREMNLTTVVATSILVNDQPLNSIKGANLDYPAAEGNEAVIVMSMRPNTVYRVTLPTSVTDSQGHALDKPFSWQFTTASHMDTPKPPMRSFARYPRMNEWDIPTNAPITVMFTSEIDPASITADSLQVHSTGGGDPIPGKISVQGPRLIFHPSSPLLPNHPYEAVVAAGIKSKWDIATERPIAWQFNTGDGPAQGPIITDAWYEMYSDRDGRRMVLHAAVENLVKPGNEGKQGASDAGALGPGYALKAAVIPLNGRQPSTAPSATPAAPAPFSPGAPQGKQGEAATNVVVAAYNHAGGRGQGNSVENGSKDADRENMRAAIKNALAKESSAQMRDSGDAAAHGDKAKGDGVYSARLILGNDVPYGPGLATFAIVLPNGQMTEPATIPFYILMTAQEQEKLDK